MTDTMLRTAGAGLSLRKLARSYLGVELGGLPARDGERGPACAGEMLGKIDDLADMIGAMGELAIDGLGH